MHVRLPSLNDACIDSPSHSVPARFRGALTLAVQPLISEEKFIVICAVESTSTGELTSRGEKTREA